MVFGVNRNVELLAQRLELLPPDMEVGLEFLVNFKLAENPFGFAAHVAVVEVDRETGGVRFLRYAAVHDCGRVINPKLLAGQVHGAIAQGLGPALAEAMVYSPEGQPLSGTLLDYAVPAADDIPTLLMDIQETPSPTNPLGVKGIGELPTVAAPVVPAATVVPARVFPVTTNPNDETVFTLERLGLRERVMHGPFDWAGFTFGLPAHWELVEGSQVELDLFTAFSGPTSPSGRPAYIGTLDIALDGTLLATVTLDTMGESTVAVPLPTTLPGGQAGKTRRADNRRTLSVTLNAPFECDPGVDAHTTLVVRATSRFVLPHRLTAPPTDLRQLPYPIVQRSVMPDVAVVVVPDTPTPAELQAAMTVAAGFGHMSGGQLTLSLTTDSRATLEQLSSGHLIVVGKINGLPLLNDITLPAPRLDAVTAAPTDGVVQLAVSPWNVDHVALVVTGDTDTGVVKAAQAVSAGTILVGARPDLAVVTQVEPQRPVAATTPTDRSLAEMGHAVTVMSSVGINTAEYAFDVLPGQATAPGAYFELTYNHSGYLNFGESGVAVSVNDQPVGGMALTPESATGLTRRMAIPPSALREGRNTLRIEAYLIPASVCAPLNVNNLWFTIQPESRLHLPAGPTGSHVLPVFDLGRYPYPFLESAILLEDTALVVAGDDPTGWETAARLAFDLGRRGKWELAAPTLYFAGDVPPEARAGKHLLIVGQPTQLPILADLHDALPAAIDAETGLPVPQNDRRLDFLLRPGVSLGYLQMFRSPWNAGRAVLTVLGSDAAGYSQAATTLTTPLRGLLRGNLALVSGSQVVASTVGAAPPVEPVAAPTEAVETVPTPWPASLSSALAAPGGRPAWILLAVFMISGLMIIVLLIAAIVGLRRRSTPGT